MASPERFSVPILRSLLPGGVKAGATFIVEFDPESQWFSLAATIVAQYLQENRRVAYAVMARPPEEARRDLSALGVDVSALIREGRLVVDDWYSATLTGGRLDVASGQAGLTEPFQRSLKVADLSIVWLKFKKIGPQAEDVVETWPPGSLGVVESGSVLLRFNDEKEITEFIESRVIPNEHRAKRISIWGMVRGIHSDSFYKRVENAADGVIDLRVMERGDELQNLLRVRSVKGQPHDTRWHQIQIRPNGEATLATSLAT